MDFKGGAGVKTCERGLNVELEGRGRDGGGDLQLINAGREAPDCTDAGWIFPQKILFLNMPLLPISCSFAGPVSV